MGVNVPATGNLDSVVMGHLVWLGMYQFLSDEKLGARRGLKHQNDVQDFEWSGENTTR